MKIGIIDESGEKLAHIERCLGDCPSGTRPRLVRFETYIEAIAELEDQQISLIFATNGGETWTLSSLVEAQSDVPVVALIERMEPKLIEQVLFSGVHDYLVMDGLNAATVLHVCQSVVARYSAHASFEQVIRSIREGVLLVDESNTIQFANASACSMLGFSFEQLLGSPFDIDTCEYVLVETLITRTDGSVVPAELRKSPLASGPAGLFLVSIRDLTDKLVANTRIQSLERNARYKDEMFASMTHELRTPLSAISNISEKLARASSEKPSPSRLVNLLHISTEALMTVVNDVLDLSKLEAGKLSIEETIFSPMSIISEIESIMSPHSREKNLLLSKAVSADLPSFVVGDPNRVRQVLLNLVSNAIKYTEQGRVEIRAWTQSREDGSVNLRFEVEDTGVGIAQSLQESAFDPYVRFEGRIKTGGTGLGLAICKMLIDLMKGTIGLKSIPGKGSLFFVEIPFGTCDPKFQYSDYLELSCVTRTDLTPFLQLVSEEALTVDSCKKILVVEDNKVNSELIALDLRGLGYEVEFAENGLEALSKVSNSSHYGLVFMDCQLPYMDGFEATRRIRCLEDEIKRNIPIIALTANVLDCTAKKCLTAGMNHYLAKPYKFKELTKLLIKYLKDFEVEKGTEAVHCDYVAGSRFEQYLASAEKPGVAVMLSSFSAETRSNLDELRGRLAAREMKQVAFVAHKLKGTCQFMGFREESSWCLALEEGSESWTELESLVSRLAERLDAYIARVGDSTCGIGGMTDCSVL